MDTNAGDEFLLGHIPGLMLLGNLGPGKAEGVETTNSGGSPNLIRSGLIVDVIEAIGLSGDDIQRVLFGAIVSPLNLVEERKNWAATGQREEGKVLVSRQQMHVPRRYSEKKLSSQTRYLHPS